VPRFVVYALDLLLFSPILSNGDAFLVSGEISTCMGNSMSTVHLLHTSTTRLHDGSLWGILEYTSFIWL